MYLTCIPSHLLQQHNKFHGNLQLIGNIAQHGTKTAAIRGLCESEHSFLVAYPQEAAAIVTVNLCMTRYVNKWNKIFYRIQAPFDSNTVFPLLTSHIIGCRRPC